MPFKEFNQLKMLVSLQDRLDQRDRRPLEHPLRLAFAMSSKTPSEFQRSYLYVNNRTSKRAHMLAKKDMKIVESQDDESLPVTDVEHINPADRYMQVGESAAGVLLDSCALPAPPAAMVWLDLSPKTGDFGRAVMKRHSLSASTTAYYVAVAPSSQCEWPQSELEDQCVERYLSGLLKVKGMDPLPEKPVEGDLPQIQVPSLNAASVSGQNLVIPDALHKKYQDGDFQEEWAKFLEEKNGVIPDVAEAPSPPTKRARTGEHNAPIAPVALNFGHVDAKDLDFTTCLLQGACTGKMKGLAFQLYPENKIYLVNVSEGDVAVTGFLTSWFKGKWWAPREADEASQPDVDVPWNFKTSSDLVFMGDKVEKILKLYDILEEKRQTAPEKALVRYHTLKENPAGSLGPGDFDIEVKNEVFWRSEKAKVEEGKEGTKSNPNTFASLVPAHVWDLDVVDILFHVRWAKQGLTGVKPAIYLKNGAILKAGKAILLTNNYTCYL